VTNRVPATAAAIWLSGSSSPLHIEVDDAIEIADSPRLTPRRPLLGSNDIFDEA
jgi:hypothetical protein